MATPKLRFKEFESNWVTQSLSNFTNRVVRKNKANICQLPLTISAQYGLVDQTEFFNKTIASKNLEGYYLVENGEFAYNKSYSQSCSEQRLSSGAPTISSQSSPSFSFMDQLEYYYEILFF